MDVHPCYHNGADIPIDGFDPRPITVPACHPTERALQRYASNETGPQRKKKVVKHLEDCPECRGAITRLRELARRFRDFERCAIASFAQP